MGSGLHEEPSDEDENFVEPVGGIVTDGGVLDLSSADQNEGPDPHGEEVQEECIVKNLAGKRMIRQLLKLRYARSGEKSGFEGK